jgi:surfeit locus 1 family protein
MPWSSPRLRAAIVLVATLVFMALTARLGIWQMSRAAQKEALQQAFDQRSHLSPLETVTLPREEASAAQQHYRPVQLRGSWQPQATVFLDNRQMNGRPGFFVVTPLKLEGGDAVLVQRGWVPRDAAERTKLPPIPTPAGTVEVVGQIVPPPGRLFDFAGPPATGPIRQNLELADFSRETGLPLRPLSVLQADTPDVSGDGLLRQWPKPAVDIQKHYGYAFQWFALCALLAGLYVWFQLIRPRFRRNA